MKKEEKKMAIDSHSRGLERSHNRGYKEEDAKANGNRMSQEELTKGC